MKEKINKSTSHSSQNEIETDLLKHALEANITGLIITDNRLNDNPIVYCNKAFEKISGYERHEIIGRNCRFLQGDDRQQDARNIIKNAISEGSPCTIEIRNYRKNGSFFWNELFLTPLKNEDGAVTHYVGVQNDISLRKHAEEQVLKVQQDAEKLIEERTVELRLSQEYLLSIFQTVRESLIILDEQMSVLNVNDHFLRVFKVSRTETEGTNLFQLGNGQWNIKKLKDLLQKILPTNNPVLDFEVEHDFPHIGLKCMLLNAHRIELEGQYKDRILLAIEDITERREMERRKDDFLTIASHELKTPLTSLKGFIQILQKAPENPVPGQFVSTLARINKQVDRLSKLINELLNVSKIQSGNIELHKDHFDFGASAREAIDVFSTNSLSHRIILEGATNQKAYGDESQIIQVINNLISNAIKYSPNANQVIVTISVISDFIKLSVEDFGLGIDLAEQEKIFERFYRVRENQKQFPGMGMGLYICKQIIINHGGSIWVESETSKGSTFSFTIPCWKKGPMDF